MPRANAMVPPEAIRIEDEVWQEAFARREPARPRQRPQLRAIDGAREVRLFDGELAEEQPAAKEVATDVLMAEAPPRPVTAAGGASVSPTPVRRAVKIQGRGAERNMPWPDATRRPPRRPYERHGFRPDRVAMWAVLLGLLLVLVAVLSAH
jgi:hypothetical protein